MSTASALVLAALLALWTGAAHAHPLAPSLLELRERDGGRVDVALRSPLVRANGAALALVLPAGCRATAKPSLERDASAEILRTTLDCGGDSLADGAAFGLDGLRESATNALVRIERADGSVAQGVIDAAQPRFALPARADRSETIASYLRLGVAHILGGFDHLLFVAALVLLVQSGRALVATVTAFTLGHALTLGCAALGFVQPPSAPIEVAIAASVFWLALGLASRKGRARGMPARLAFGFGLLHGFGFAAALAEAGLASADLPLALASFNAGIELGQLAIVLALLLFVRALRRYERPLAYAFGALAGFWLIERSLAALGLG
ncbi:MAG: HupE/UreJ family protein [Myxococcota bacterium]